MRRDSKFNEFKDFEINRIVDNDSNELSDINMLDDDTKEQIIRLYLKGFSEKEISSRLNINISIINEIINKNCFCASL